MRGFITSVTVLTLVGLLLYGVTYYLTLTTEWAFSDLPNSIGLLYLFTAPIVLVIRYLCIPLYHRVSHEVTMRDLHKSQLLFDKGIINEDEYKERISQLKKSL